MVINLKPGDVVRVDWRDSYGTTGWIDKRELHEIHDCDEVKIQTVGYVIKADKNFVSVAQSLSEHNDDIHNTMTIPSAMIFKTRTLVKGVSAVGGKAGKGSH